MQAASKGRGYTNGPLWQSIENQLSAEIGKVVTDATLNLSTDPRDILRAHLDPLAHRLNLILKS